MIKYLIIIFPVEFSCIYCRLFVVYNFVIQKNYITWYVSIKKMILAIEIVDNIIRAQNVWDVKLETWINDETKKSIHRKLNEEVDNL